MADLIPTTESNLALVPAPPDEPIPTVPDRPKSQDLPPVVFVLTDTTLIRFKVFLKGFTDELKRRHPTSATGATYQKRGSAFLQWLGRLDSTPTKRLDRMTFDAYRTYLDQRFTNPRTKNGYLVALRQFMAFLVRFHPGLVNHAVFLKGWECSRTHTRRHLPAEDAKTFLATLQTDVRHSELQRRRNYAMAYLMLKTGLRTIEVSRAQIGHLQESIPGKVWKLWVHGKGRGSADETVQIVREVFEALQAYLILRTGPLQPTDPLFATTACYDRSGQILTAEGRPLSTRTINRILTEGLILAGVKKPGIVVHSLRHSTPTYALLNDANPVRVQKMMRHKHYSTTEIYVEEVQKLIGGAEEAVTQI